MKAVEIKPVLEMKLAYLSGIYCFTGSLPVYNSHLKCSEYPCVNKLCPFTCGKEDWSSNVQKDLFIYC